MTTAHSPLEEGVLWIRVNGTRIATLACSPHDPLTLAFGYLLTEGWTTSATDVRTGNEVVSGPGVAAGIDVVLPAAGTAAAQARRAHMERHGCGLRHELDCAPGSLKAFRAGAPAAAPHPGRLVELFRTLFAAVDDAAPGGGVHGGALSDGSGLHVVDTDVARHCVVDRVAGHALRGGVMRGSMGMLITSRISGAIALKAARAGFGWIASRSRATTLAVEIAAESGMTLVQRAVRRERP